jgi:hypothetical protein
MSSDQRGGRVIAADNGGHVVVDAVYVERVSATKFPANREINREDRRNRPEAANAAVA